MVKAKDEEWFKKIVKGCFGYRRKTLANALKHSHLSLPQDIEQRIKGMGIDPQRRPETLSIEEFVHLAEVLKS
jgi:16S rRNA (adenine1518-N6/adenine1519-N6)-dimethyltransferase